MSSPRGNWGAVRAGLAVLALGLATPLPAGAAGVRHIKAVDADNHTVTLNRAGVVTALIGTSEDSQDAARQAGIEMYPFQGRDDFQLIVAVDLRGSMANWAPSIAVGRMRSSLDGEAKELKPYFVRNGNRRDPRGFCHVVPDFNGKIFTQLGWPDTSSDLRAIVFGADGREYRRFDKVDNMDALFNAVRSAIADYISLRKTRQAAAPQAPDTRTSALSPPEPPLPPEKPAPAKP
jgi:hypothetical protein